MTIKVRAVYEGGVLRLAQPLALDEGETVDVIVAKTKQDPQPLNEDEVAQRLKAAKSIAEWVKATKLLPANEDGYDILQRLNANRIWSQDRPLLPGGGKPS